MGDKMDGVKGKDDMIDSWWLDGGVELDIREAMMIET